jgi:hypothetical protein
MKIITILLIAIGCLTTSLASADDTNSTISAAQPAQTDEVLKNDTVIQLKKLGLGESVIVEKIKTSKCEFDVSMTGLTQLKAADVSDNVISAMISAHSAAKGNSGVAAPVAAAAADPNDPKSPHDAGIYYYQEIDGKPKMTELEPTVYTQVKSGVGIFMAYGQTVNSKAVLHPAHAMLQCANRRPVFYFYFENTQSGLGETRNIATSPNEFVLAQFEVKDKDKDKFRTLIVGQINAYSGTQSGPKDQSVRPLQSEKLAPGVYKVSPSEDLLNGEFCFFYGGNATFGAYGTMGSSKVFDFGINDASGSQFQPVETTSQTTKKGFK